MCKGEDPRATMSTKHEHQEMMNDGDDEDVRERRVDEEHVHRHGEQHDEQHDHQHDEQHNHKQAATATRSM